MTQIDDFPQWFIDVQAATHGMSFGRIPLELVIANDKIAKVIGSKTQSIKFKPTDVEQKAARLWVLDILNSQTTDGTTTFSVAHHGDKITVINTFDQVEYKYPV